MPKTLPPLPWLLAFDAAARHLSMTRAAEELGLTQSAVSQQIRLLEHRFALRLFTRRPKGLELTDAGRRLLPQVSDSIDVLSQIVAQFDTDRGVQPLTIAASVSFARSFITPNLPGFLAQHPEAQLRLRSTLWPDDAARSQSDIDIRFAPAKRMPASAQQLCQDHVVAVSAPGLLPPKPTWQDIRSAPRIEIVGTGQTWQRWSTGLSLTAPEGQAQIVDSHDLALDLARAGVGVTLSSLLLATPSLRDGSLVRPLPLSLPAHEGYFLTVSKDAQSPLADAFATWITAEVNRVSSSFAPP